MCIRDSGWIESEMVGIGCIFRVIIAEAITIAVHPLSCIEGPNIGTICDVPLEDAPYI